MVRDDFQKLVATAWKHDEELGRGYLLLSTSHQYGKIWQWETGGGPIPIGKTLSMVNSGCRSEFHQNCSLPDSGSGGIIVDSLHEPPRLIVAEWGEGRISRLEENGARTPLIIQLTSASGEEDRLYRPFQLLMTPFGDLLGLDSTMEGGDILWQLPQAHKIPGLESLGVSRKAHSWKELPAETFSAPQKLLQSRRLGGVALVPNNWMKVYVTMRQGDSVTVVVLSIEDDEEEDEDNDDDKVAPEENEKVEGSQKTNKRQSAIFFDYSQYAKEPGPIEIDEKGNMYLAIDGGILFLSSSGHVTGRLSIPGISIVDLTLGDDRFLYISTATKLFRLRVRNKLLQMPTDLVITK
jgi:hypothetical protein